MKMKTTLLAVAALTGATLSSTAQVIYSIDYDTNTSNYTQFEGTGTTITSSYASGSNTNGVGGTTAASFEFDSSSLSDGDDYSIKFFTNQNTTVNTATTDDLSLFDLDFSFYADGLINATDSFSVKLTINGISSTSNVYFTIVEDSYEDISISLSDFTFSTTLTLADINSGSITVTFENYSKGDDIWGYDTDNALYVDNITITQVPEPSTYAALAGMMAIGAVMLRRRRS
jgi:hypothetical protein